VTAEECIAALDAALEANGEDIVLRRVVGVQPNTLNIDVTCRANVRTWRLKEENLVAGIAQAVDIVVISPTPIARAQWPGGVPVGQLTDPSVPRRLDKVIIAGRVREIDAVEPIRLSGQVVRIELQVLG